MDIFTFIIFYLKLKWQMQVKINIPLISIKTEINI